jgi:hypothetical protein
MNLVFSTMSNVKKETKSKVPGDGSYGLQEKTFKGVTFIYDDEEFEKLQLTQDVKDKILDEITLNFLVKLSSAKLSLSEIDLLYLLDIASNLHTILHVPFLISFINIEMKLNNILKKTLLNGIKDIFGENLYNKIVDYATAKIEKELDLITRATLHEKKEIMAQQYDYYKTENNRGLNNYYYNMLPNKVVVPLNDDIELVLNLKIQKK